MGNLVFVEFGMFGRYLGGVVKSVVGKRLGYKLWFGGVYFRECVFVFVCVCVRFRVCLFCVCVCLFL